MECYKQIEMVIHRQKDEQIDGVTCIDRQNVDQTVHSLNSLVKTEDRRVIKIQET